MYIHYSLYSLFGDSETFAIRPNYNDRLTSEATNKKDIETS